MMMKRNLLAALLVLLLCGLARAQLQKGDFVAICGDSITEQRLYSVFIEDYLLMCQPVEDVTAMQHGWSGQTTWDFAGRMRDDSLRYRPTVATTCFGMNDGGYAPLDARREQRYRESTQQIIDQLKGAGVRTIVIGSNGAVDLTTFNRGGVNSETYNRTLARLRDVAKEVADKNGVIFADVYTPMIDVMTKAKAAIGPNYDVAGRDGIHPQANGHLVMAYAFLKALGCDGEIGKFTVDLAGQKTEATAGHKVLSMANGAVEIESTRYPFCFSGEAGSANATTKIIEFFPFNQDLNRMMLVVKGGAGRLKVTWGNSSKEFDGEQLAKGVNLAAEFLVNPFSEFFQDVDASVRQQQAYELRMIKGYVHNLPQFLAMVPEAGQQKLQEVADMMATERQLMQAEARKRVIPVKHTIRIETAR